MGVRNGAEFIAGLKAHPKDVWIAGRQVGDVTSDLALRRPVESLAGLFDQQVQPELREIMTYEDEESGQPAGLSFLIPRSRDDLARRRAAMQVWAEATFGLMGRSPDYLNTVLVAFVDALEFFAQGGARFADNVQGYYRYCRDNDLFLTHAIVNPQIDRSKSSSEQAEPFIHLGVVDQTRDGLVVRGAKMLATHGPTADELLVYPLPGSLRPGEEDYALAFGIPTDAPGLRFICREPFDAGMQSEWDHPLGARFEEPDAVAVFNDVLVPWERVFLHADVARGNALFAETSIQNHTGHQTAIRGLAKCQFLTGLAVALTRAVKTDGFLHVQEQLGELLGYLQLIEGAILLSEQNAETSGRGTVRPAYAPLQALRYQIPRFYERMVQVTQVLGAGGLLINPTQADLQSTIAPDIARYYRGAGVEAAERIRLFKLAWDATGTQFGQRQLQYERYYAGDPVRTAATLYLKHDAAPLLARIEKALGVAESADPIRPESLTRAADLPLGPPDRQDEGVRGSGSKAQRNGGQAMSDRMIHLVGSIPFRTPAEVFERVGRILGPRLYSIPDGETGERLGWIACLEPIFAAHPQFESTGQKYTARASGSDTTGKYRLKAGVSAEDVRFDILPFARIAMESFREFESAKRTGTLPPSVRFQLTLASPISVIRRFVADEAEQEALIPSYGQGLIAEVGKLASVVPHDQLAVQWDVASAVFERLERGVPTRFGQTREEMTKTFAAAHGKLGMGVPSDVHLQFHLCYGDASHMHSIEPATSRLLVDFTNRLRTEVKRTIELVHMPVPRARTDEAYYEPLSDLDVLPETKIALGLVHYTDGVDGTRRRIAVAEKYKAEFAVATECGFGRRNPETIVPLLRIHAEVAGLRS